MAGTERVAEAFVRWNRSIGRSTIPNNVIF